MTNIRFTELRELYVKQVYVLDENWQRNNFTKLNILLLLLGHREMEFQRRFYLQVQAILSGLLIFCYCLTTPRCFIFVFSKTQLCHTEVFHIFFSSKTQLDHTEVEVYRVHDVHYKASIPLAQRPCEIEPYW